MCVRRGAEVVSAFSFIGPARKFKFGAFNQGVCVVMQGVL